MYDIGIIGAGPAGATLARLLADRYRVLLLDSGRQKCCGGILSQTAQKVLAKLKLTLPKHLLVEPQPSAVTIMDWDSQLVRSYARQYINFDRTAFDRWLLSLVPQSVDVRHNAVYQHSEGYGESLTLHFRENDEPKTAQVRWLVGADGAFSTVRREFFANEPTPKRYVAVQHWFERDTVSVAPNCGIDVWNDYIGIFNSALTDFYCWAIPKNGQIILGGAFPLQESRGLCSRHNASAAMQTIVAKLESQGLHLGSPIKREAGQIVRPLHSSSLFFGNAKIMLAGEASGLISPSGAEGISGALASALHLAEAFSPEGFDPALYRHLLRKRLWQLWQSRVKVPFMFHPTLRKFVLLSGLTALRR